MDTSSSYIPVRITEMPLRLLCDNPVHVYNVIPMILTSSPPLLLEVHVNGERTVGLSSDAEGSSYTDTLGPFFI